MSALTIRRSLEFEPAGLIRLPSTNISTRAIRHVGQASLATALNDSPIANRLHLATFSPGSSAREDQFSITTRFVTLGLALEVHHSVVGAHLTIHLVWVFVFGGIVASSGSRRRVSGNGVIYEDIFGDGLAFEGAMESALRASTTDAKGGTLKGGDVFFIPSIAVECRVEFCREYLVSEEWV
jgi:hypothetical protein